MLVANPFCIEQDGHHRPMSPPFSLQDDCSTKKRPFHPPLRCWSWKNSVPLSCLLDLAPVHQALGNGFQTFSRIITTEDRFRGVPAELT